MHFIAQEGHRFAIRDIKVGEKLLSWGLPFAVCTSPIKTGEYLCNLSILEALRARGVSFRLPIKPNFKNLIKEFSDEATATLDTSPQISMLPKDVVSGMHFTGFDRRAEGRGVGTRNYVLVIGTTALTASFARMVQHTLTSRRHAR